MTTDNKYKILVINPGSNSTKIAIFEDAEKVDEFSIAHEADIIGSFSSAVYDQFQYRLGCIRRGLEEKGIDLDDFDAVVGRGGFARIKDAGTYRVNDQMCEDLANPTAEHVANLGGILAKTLADPHGLPAYIRDPTCIDEMADVARVTGFEGMERGCKWQPLSHKATAHKLADELGVKYEDSNFIIAHLGGGITVGAHAHGRVIDVNNGLDGDGPFSVDRPGTMPIKDVVAYCFDRGLSKEEVVKTFISKGGIYSYFGTVDTKEVEDMANAGDPKAQLVLDAMAYQIVKEMGAMATVLEGKVDAIAMTGGIAYSKYITSRIAERVEWIAPVYIYPGSLEMESLALGALNDLTGKRPAKEYVRQWTAAEDVKEESGGKLNTFAKVENYVLSTGIVKTIALCGSHDMPALSALVEAKRKGVARGILVGDEAQTRELLVELGEDVDDWTFIDEPEETESARKAVELVRTGKADVLMKGLMQTSSYMRAILNKETGILPPGHILSETTAFEYPDQGRMVFISDCGINIEPNLETKVKITENAVALAKCFGVETPYVAALSAVEKVNPKIRSTVDAAALADMDWDGCVVEGPFALDNAVSVEAAEHKGISGTVAGKADVLLVPDLCAGNILHKSINFFAGSKLAGAVCGTEQPVILTSRTDSPNTKYNSILTALLQRFLAEGTSAEDEDGDNDGDGEERTAA